MFIYLLLSRSFAEEEPTAPEGCTKLNPYSILYYLKTQTIDSGKCIFVAHYDLLIFSDSNYTTKMWIFHENSNQNTQFTGYLGIDDNPIAMFDGINDGYSIHNPSRKSITVEIAAIPLMKGNVHDETDKTYRYILATKQSGTFEF